MYESPFLFYFVVFVLGVQCKCSMDRKPGNVEDLVGYGPPNMGDYGVGVPT